MRKTNYAFQRRQRDLEKQRKREEKEQEKAARKAKADEVAPDGASPADASTEVPESAE
jgi:hypothetical protein